MGKWSVLCEWPARPLPQGKAVKHPEEEINLDPRQLWITNVQSAQPYSTLTAMPPTVYTCTIQPRHTSAHIHFWRPAHPCGEEGHTPEPLMILCQFNCLCSTLEVINSYVPAILPSSRNFKSQLQPVAPLRFAWALHTETDFYSIIMATILSSTSDGFLPFICYGHYFSCIPQQQYNTWAGSFFYVSKWLFNTGQWKSTTGYVPAIPCYVGTAMLLYHCWSYFTTGLPSHNY